MGKPSRDKGQRFERAIVNAFQQEGLWAERVPLSGAAGGSFAGDIQVAVLGRDRVFEAKKRANGFKQIYDWMASHFGLFIAADRRPTLVVLSLEHFIWLLQRAEQARVQEGMGDARNVADKGQADMLNRGVPPAS